jgi:hypothetical protein
VEFIWVNRKSKFGLLLREMKADLFPKEQKRIPFCPDAQTEYKKLLYPEPY